MADKFVLTINCGNVAFDDGQRDAQLAQILRGIANKLEIEGASGFYENIKDINGNIVGQFAVKPSEYWN